MFETLRAYRGNFFHLPEHWRRLVWSCQGLGKKLPFSTLEMSVWTYQVLKESGWEDAILRLSVHWNEGGEGILLGLVREFKSHPAAWYRKGVVLKTAVTRRPDLKADNPQMKCSQYVSAVLAQLDESLEKAHELVFLGGGGFVAEGSVSNLFITKGKRVLTPSAGSGILSGVTRAFVIHLCRKRGLQVEETFFTRHDIYYAEECFMTNTSSEILPVVCLDGRKIGTGKPGKMTKILARDFKKEIHDKN